MRLVLLRVFAKYVESVCFRYVNAVYLYYNVTSRQAVANG